MVGMKKVVLGVIITLLASSVFAQGPLTTAGNLRVNSDANGNLMTAFGVASGTAGPLTVFPNLRLRTDASGNLLIAVNGGTATPNILCLDAANVDVCLQRQAAGILNLTNLAAGTTFTRLNFGTALVGNPALKVSTNTLQVRLADDSTFATLSAGQVNANGSIFAVGSGVGLGIGNLSIINTSPTATTFCTSPTVPSNNGTFAFTINVGTGCATSVGTITFPAATTGWVVKCMDVTTPASYVIDQTGGTATTATITAYARTTGLASNWTSSDVLRCMAVAY